MTATATIDRIIVREYLDFYAGLPGLVSICSDADKWKGRRFHTDTVGLGEAADYAMQLDRQRPKGTYVQVTTLREAPSAGRGGEDLAHCLTYVWADGDFGTVGHKPSLDDLPHPADADTVHQIVTGAIPLEPTVWINSGGGLNPLWRVSPYSITDDAARSRIKALTTDWQAILGAAAYEYGCTWDTEVGNLDRLTRLPGTVNGKDGLSRPTSITGGSGEVYDLQTLVDIAADLAPAAHRALEQASAEKQARKAARLGRPARPATAAKQQAANSTRSGSSGPLNVLAELLRFRDVLEPAGFTFRGYHGDGREKYLRPAGSDGEASSEYSLLCDENVAVNWSERSDLPVGALAPGQKLTLGRLYAHFNYGGDVSAAAKDIMRAAAGKAAEGPADLLPPSVLAEVKRRCMAEPIRLATPQPQFADEDWGGMAPDEDVPSRRRVPGLLPDEFYEAREAHRHIRQAGHSRNRSGDVALMASLTRLSGIVSHNLRADTGVGGAASLNLFVGILGPSGIGKSTGVEVADQIMPVPPDLDFRDGLPVGSGEGIAEVFMDTVEEGTGRFKRGGEEIMKIVRKQVRRNAFFWVDEGVALTRLMKERSGSTLGETLRSAAVGQTLGATNASKETSRYIPRGSYSMGMLVGFQPETVLPLFDEQAEGTPQRFLWTQVVDPAIPDEQPQHPGQLTGWRCAIVADKPTPITFDAEIRRELRRADLARARGEVAPADMNPLDSHAPLMRVKVASLLAILGGRHHVNPEDWELAAMVWEASCDARDWVLEFSARQRQMELEKVTQARITEAVRIEAAKVEAEADRDDKSVERVAQRVAFLVHQNGAMTRSAIRDKVAGRQKKYMNDALGYAQLREWVTDDGKKIAPGRSRPG